MVVRRLALVLLTASALALPAAPAAAGGQESCAQQVIRDWYAGGRVDGLYPLACYRAAIRALPADVLHYSNADRDIARALALARRGLRDPGNGPVPAGGARPDADVETAAPESRATTPPPASQSLGASAGPTGEGPVQLASGNEPAAAGAELPYPVLLLGALACILLASGAVGWVAGRGR